MLRALTISNKALNSHHRHNHASVASLPALAKLALKIRGIAERASPQRSATPKWHHFSNNPIATINQVVTPR